MLGAIERASLPGADPLDAAHHQSPEISVALASSDGIGPDGKTSLSFAQLDEGAPNGASIGDLALPGSIIQEKVPSIQIRLKDFAARTDLSAIAALIVRLDNDLRKSARQDLWAAVASDVAAQGAAAKAIRDSGLCQLFGTMLTSAGGLAGAGLNLKGARRSQARFDEITTRTQRPLPGSELRPEGPSSPTSQVQRIEAGEDGLGHLAEREGAPPSSDLAPDVPNRPAGQAQRSEAEDNVPQDAAASDHIAEQGSGNSVTPHASEIEPAGQGHAPTPPPEPDARPHGTDALELSRITEAQTAAQGEVMKWTGLSAIATEASKIPGAGLTMGATHYQEEQARREADSTKAKAQAEDEKQFIESYQTVIEDMLDKLAELRRADSETRSKLVSMA